jgi:hypothetical protein
VFWRQRTPVNAKRRIVGDRTETAAGMSVAAAVNLGSPRIPRRRRHFYLAFDKERISLDESITSLDNQPATETSPLW